MCNVEVRCFTNLESANIEALRVYPMQWNYYC